MTLTYGTCIVENISEDQPRQEYIKRSFRIALASNVRQHYSIQLQFLKYWNEGIVYPYVYIIRKIPVLIIHPICIMKSCHAYVTCHLLPKVLLYISYCSIGTLIIIVYQYFEIFPVVIYSLLIHVSSPSSTFSSGQ